MAGTYVTKSKSTNNTHINDIFDLVTSQMSAFATEHAVTSTLATGGVCWPIAKFKVTIIPKCTGSMPTAFTKGITIGTVKIIAATECKKKTNN